MALKGDLASVELAQVFQMLALNQKVGLLNIEGPVEDRALYFDHRGVTLWYSEHALLEQVLTQQVCAGRIQKDLYRQVEAKAGGSVEAATKLLLSANAMTEDDLAKACRQEIEEEIYDVFFWKDARFEFHEGSKALPDRDGRINERYFFSPDSLIMEAARRMDEWAFIQEKVAGPDEVFLALSDGPDASGLDEETLAVLEHVDGKRSVGRVVEVAGRPAFHVHKALACLVDQGFIAPIHPDDLPMQAQECLAEGRTEEAIQLLEKAIHERVTPAACHAAAASIYDKLGERAASCYHQKCYAEKLVEEGKTREAAEILARVRELLPTDLSARERLVELQGSPKAAALPGFDPIAEGKLLVDLLVEMGETDRARDVIERLLVGRASDLELKKTLIGVYSRAGDTKRVLELYESIANDLVLRHDLIEAVKYLQKILLFDRSRKDISDRIRQLYVLDERKRIRRRGFTFAVIVILLLSTLGGGYYLYESYIRSLYDTLPARADSHIAKKDYPAALTLYEEFMSSYPFSLTARRARGEIARIQALKSQHEDELENQRVRADAERERTRAEYNDVWDRYKDLDKREHDPEDALKLLDRIEDLVKSAGSPDDRAWARDKKLEEIRNNLREHLAGAWMLARKAKHFLEQGQVAQAHNLVMALHDRYGLTPTAKTTPIPLLVETRPNGAQVFLDGEPVVVAGKGHRAVTPVILEILPNEKKKAVFQLRGHTSMETILTSKSPFPVVVTLPVNATVSFDLNKPLSGPFSVGNGIAVLSSRSQVFVVEVPSGSIRFRWKLPDLAEVISTPIVSPNRVTFATSDSRILSYSLRDGSRAWERKLRTGSRLKVAEKGGYLYVCDDDGMVFCQNTDTGRELWFARLTTGVTTVPTLQGKAVFLTTTDGRLVILRSDDGAFLLDQKLDGSPVSPPLPGGDCVFVLLEGGRLVCVDLNTHKTRWSRLLQEDYRTATICLGDRSVLVATGDGKIAKRSVRDGNEELVRDLGGRPDGDLVTSGGSVYVLLRSPDRKRPVLQSLRADELSFRWEHELEDEPTRQLVVSSGVAYVVTETGKVLGFE